MPRKRKYPEKVNIQIPYDIVEMYETDFFELIFPEKSAKMARKIVSYIKKHGFIDRYDWRELATDEAEHKLFNRTLNKMVSLGLLKRRKGGEFILSEEFSTKLGVLIQKWDAIRLRSE